MNRKSIALIALGLLLTSCVNSNPTELSLGVETLSNITPVTLEDVEGERVLIERSKIDELEEVLPDVCDFDAVDGLRLHDEEDEWVDYRNESKGLAMKLPYNSEWGADMYQVEPFAERDDALFFGAITVRGEGCGAWVEGDQLLNFLPLESKDEVLQRLQAESDALEFGYEIKSLTMAGKEVVEYNKDGMCGGGGTIIIGEKFNYELATQCGSNTREDLIETMEFI